MPIGLLVTLRDWILGPFVPEPYVPQEVHTQYDNEKLTSFEETEFRTGACPDCCELSLTEGPHGGLSINYYCRNQNCESRFNDMGPFGIQRISDAQPARSSTGYREKARR